MRPTPAEVKRATGNPGHRPVSEAPDFAPGVELAPPSRWPEAGHERAEWLRLVPDLQRCGIAKAIHQGLLERVCELYAAGVELYAKADYSGHLKVAMGYRISLTELGCTPSSAGRIGFLGGSGSKPAAEPTDEFFPKPHLA